jgi:hypothetical protein
MSATTNTTTTTTVEPSWMTVPDIPEYMGPDSGCLTYARRGGRERAAWRETTFTATIRAFALPASREVMVPYTFTSGVMYANRGNEQIIIQGGDLSAQDVAEVADNLKKLKIVVEIQYMSSLSHLADEVIHCVRRCKNVSTVEVEVKVECEDQNLKRDLIWMVEDRAWAVFPESVHQTYVRRGGAAVLDCMVHRDFAIRDGCVVAHIQPLPIVLWHTFVLNHLRVACCQP